MHRITQSKLFLPLTILGLCLCIYMDAILGYRSKIVSEPHGDIAYWFYFVRQFGFDALRQGRIPQWNPHIYGGVPYFGGWQAALFYPPNWLYLILPLNLALTIDPAISTYLTGLFGALLARRLGLTPISSLLTGIILMFGGPYFSHVWSGHLSALAAMAWAPLLLLSVDTIIDRPGLKPVLIGALALAMQILAGHPQTVFNTALMLAIYAAARLIRCKTRMRIIVPMIGMALLACAISAVQLFTGLQVSTESARASGLTFHSATSFSYPPENLLTNLIPFFYGDITHVAYWGRWTMWETASFVSVSALVLIALGVCHGQSRRRWLWLGIMITMLVLAMGRYTPLYWLAYHALPCLSRFRAPSRFLFEASIFAALLAGAGLDPLLCGAARTKIASRIMIGCFSVLALSAAIARYKGVAIASAIYKHAGRHNNPKAPSFSKIVHAAAPFVAHQLLEAGLIALVIGIVLHECRGKQVRRWALTLAVVSIAELTCYAHVTRSSFSPKISELVSMQQWARSHHGDFRILQQGLPIDSALRLGLYDVSGYDPMVSGRYQKLLDAANVPTFDSRPDDKDIDPSPVLQLLRCKYVIDTSGGRNLVTKCDDPLPHGLMVYQFELMPRAKDAIEELVWGDIDPQSTVILSSRPAIGAVRAHATGSVNIIWENSDTMVVDAVSTSPGVLLITDAYSRFWKATPLAGSIQCRYETMPADYALMGIPVCAGHHHFEMEYRPPFFRIGAAISILGLIVCGLLGIVVLCSSRRVHE